MGGQKKKSQVAPGLFGTEEVLWKEHPELCLAHGQRLSEHFTGTRGA